MMLFAGMRKVKQLRFIDSFLGRTLTHSVVGEIFLASCFMASKRAKHYLTLSAAIKFGVTLRR